MQPVEITLRYVVAAASIALAVTALRLHGATGALPALLTAALVLPPLDAPLSRLFPESAGQQPSGQGVLRTTFALLLTTLRVGVCFAGFLGSLYIIKNSPGRAALCLEHAPPVEYRPQVTLEGTALGASRHGEPPPRLQLNGQPVPVQAGRFVTRQPLQMGLNTFRMVLDVADGANAKARTLEQTVVVRRVSEEEYDAETFGRSDCSLSEPRLSRSGAWGSGAAASQFSGSAELTAARLRGRCVQELTASRMPLSEQAATVELRATVARGRVKVLLRHPDGAFERLTVTPERPLSYQGKVQLIPVATTATHPGNPSDGTPPTSSIEEFWLAYVSLESLGQGEGAAAGGAPASPDAPASPAATDADAVLGLTFAARSSLE